MLPSLCDYLACPTCGEELGGDFEDVDRGHVITGTLSCRGCHAAYPIAAGVPRMNLAMEGLERVSRAFEYQWKAHDEGKLESDTVYGHTPEEDWRNFLERMGATPAHVQGAVILDAGCGPAQFTHLAGEHGAAAVIGIDIHDGVDQAFARCRDLENVHIVQGNLLAPPLKKGIFDLVWCSGVLHHTPDPRGGHRALSRLVRPGGTLYVFVYAKRFNPFRLVRRLLDVVRVTRLPEPLLFRFSQTIAYPSLALLHAYRATRRIPALRPRGPRGERTVRRRSLREVQLTWFDALAPEYDSRHTEREVMEWFSREGFERITAIEEPKVGVRGTAPRDETVTVPAAGSIPAPLAPDR